MQIEKTPIEIFRDEVASIDEADYGDFMRKANHSLILLKEQIYNKAPLHVQGFIDELKYIIDYMPNWNVDSTKEKVAQLAEEIRSAAQIP